MRSFLIILGILSIIGGFTLGFSETMKDLKLTVESVFVGFVQSVTYFALAYLVDKADKNEAQRKADHEDLRKILLAGLPKKKCPFCDREYDLDRKVCPNCNK